MHHRLLSFLSDFERALVADDPSPDEGSWETSRSVSYHRGLARLNLAVRTPASLTPRGHVLVQSHALADGTPCLKATLFWENSTRHRAQAIYTKPEMNWTSEARKVAAEWMAGAPAELATEELPTG